MKISYQMFEELYRIVIWWANAPGTATIKMLYDSYVINGTESLRDYMTGPLEKFGDSLIDKINFYEQQLKIKALQDAIDL